MMNRAGLLYSPGIQEVNVWCFRPLLLVGRRILEIQSSHYLEQRKLFLNLK